ncbi:hypothetical protein LLH23_17645 [bacterium]|nr:hypothetical protein [bacterium]
MRRYAPLLVLIVIGLALGVWQWRRPRPAPRAATPATALQPTAPSVQAALAFLNAWAQGDAAGAYGMLSAGMRKVVSQSDFAGMMAQRKFTSPQSLVHAETVQAAYVICSIQAKPSGHGDKGCAGFSLLLKKEETAWKVAQIQEEEKLFEKYEDLRLSPGKTSGWVVTYQNEKGQVITITLPEL